MNKVQIIEFYLFDDVPLIYQLQNGEVFEVRTNQVNRVFEVDVYNKMIHSYCECCIHSRDPEFQENYVIGCRWNTGKWNVKWEWRPFKVIN